MSITTSITYAGMKRALTSICGDAVGGALDGVPWGICGELYDRLDAFIARGKSV